MPPLDLDPNAPTICNAATLAVLAEAAYCRSDDALLRTIQQQTIFSRNIESFGEPFQLASGKWVDTQGMVVWNQRHVVLAFRGTQEWTDVLTDLDGRPRTVDGAKLHSGFAEAYDSVAERVARLTRKRMTANTCLWITGHSLGGALATLAAANLGAEFDRLAVYTFGQPAVGDAGFASRYAQRHHRYVNNHDPVPLVPPQVPLGGFLGRLLSFLGWQASLPEILRTTFAHVGAASYFDAQGQLVDTAPGASSLVRDLTTLLLAGGNLSIALKDWLVSKAGDHGIANYVRCCRAAAAVRADTIPPNKIERRAA